MDFSISSYKKFIASFKYATYDFQAYNEFSQNPCKRTTILRHDVLTQLNDSPHGRIIVLTGARQTGKTTLVK